MTKQESNYWYNDYYTIVSASCAFYALDRSRPYLMINGSMTNLFDECEFTDNSQYYQIHYQCNPFYEPVIEELNNNKQLLLDYKRELKEKFTPVTRTSEPDPEEEQQNNNDYQ